MKKLLFALFTFAVIAPAAPLYILQIDNNPYDVAGDYTVVQSGPEPYADWVSSGVVAWVIEWRENDWIRSFSFNPCPAFGPCVPLNYTVFAARGGDPVPVASAAAEPGTLFLELGAGSLALACAQRKRKRG